MFDNIQHSFTKLLDKVRSTSTLTKLELRERLDEMRAILVGADVTLDVIDEIDRNIEDYFQQDRVKSKQLTSEQIFVKGVGDILEKKLSWSGSSDLQWREGSTNVYLLFGLQGWGKTTTAAKLGLLLKDRGKRGLLVSLDLKRPGAITQLRQLATQTGLESFEDSSYESPLQLSKRAHNYATSMAYDFVIFDTAGRLHLDTELIAELKDIERAISPIESIMVIDSMLGQDAANSLPIFGGNLKITSIILSKTDGLSKIGAALSAVSILRAPIKFVGSGESVKDLERFDPKGTTSRILGMGDILGLVEKIERRADKEALEKGLSSSTRFTFNDLYTYLEQLTRIGGLEEVMKSLPVKLRSMPQINSNAISNDEFMRDKAIILSMTPKERNCRTPLNRSRRERLAKGAGVNPQDVKLLLKRFEMQSRAMSELKGLSPLQMINKARGLLGF